MPTPDAGTGNMDAAYIKRWMEWYKLQYSALNQRATDLDKRSKQLDEREAALYERDKRMWAWADDLAARERVLGSQMMERFQRRPPPNRYRDQDRGPDRRGYNDRGGDRGDRGPDRRSNHDYRRSDGYHHQQQQPSAASATNWAEAAWGQVSAAAQQPWPTQQQQNPAAGYNYAPTPSADEYTPDAPTYQPHTPPGRPDSPQYQPGPTSPVRP